MGGGKAGRRRVRRVGVKRQAVSGYHHHKPPKTNKTRRHQKKKDQVRKESWGGRWEEVDAQGEREGGRGRGEMADMMGV